MKLKPHLFLLIRYQYEVFAKMIDGEDLLWALSAEKPNPY